MVTEPPARSAGLLSAIERTGELTPIGVEGLVVHELPLEDVHT
jgi:hypothetical protein